jgi:hypothetical protein
MARKKSPASAVRRLHRSLGAGAAIFVLFMVMSGLVINHSHDLGLDQRHVSQSSLLKWYGFGEPQDIRSFVAGNDWLSFAGSQLYLNDRHVTTITNGVGAVRNTEMLIAAGSEELLLLDHDGTLIERLPWGLGPIEAIGLYENNAVVVKSGNQLWLADAQMRDWQQAGSLMTDTVWSSPVSPHQDLNRAITQKYRGDGLSIERVLLDFHSGRIFGSVGVLVYDLLALAVGFMAISGLVLWLRGRRNGNGNGNGKNGRSRS